MSAGFQAYPVIHCDMDSTYSMSKKCPASMDCRRKGVVLPDGTDVSGNPHGGNLHGGFLSFDNLGAALLTVLTASSQEGALVQHFEPLCFSLPVCVYFPFSQTNIVLLGSGLICCRV